MLPGISHAGAIYAKFLEAALDEIFVVSVDGHLEYLNRAGAARFGLQPDAAEGRSIAEVFSADLAATIQRQIERVTVSRTPIYIEQPLRFPDGSEGWRSVWFVPIKAQTGEFTSVLAISRDIDGQKRVETELVDSRERYRQIAETTMRLRQAVEVSAEIIFMTDVDGVITFVNQQFEQTYGYSAAEVVGRVTPRILKGGGQSSEYYAEFWRRLRNGEIVRGEFVNRAKDGRQLTVEVAVNPSWNKSRSAIVGFLAIQQDITDRKQRDDELRRKNLVLATEHDTTLDGIMVVDERGHLLSVNDRFRTLWQLSDEEFSSTEAAPLVAAVSRRAADARGCLNQFRVLMERPDEILHEEIELLDGRALDGYSAPMRDPEGRYYGRVWFFRDISARKQSEKDLLRMQEQLRNQALYDSLTGLANRRLLLELVGHALRSLARDPSRGFGLLFVDVDDFKLINDSLGHEAGDQLLTAVARRLQSGLRRDDVLARLGGDEFVVLTGPVRTPDDLQVLARRLSDLLGQPLSLPGREATVTASIGVTSCTDPTDTPQSLLREADTAMYSAKKGGKHQYQFFNVKMREEAVTRFELEQELRQALDRQEFVIGYQPIVDATTGRISAFEALLRWRHPTRGLLRPSTFLTLADDLGLMIPIGNWVLARACADSQMWRGRGVQGVRVAVNVSPGQFRDPSFVAAVEGILEATGVDPQTIELELSENIVLSSTELTTARLERLARTGVRLSVDDFGVVHTSVRYLAAYPITTLKLDQSFVRELTTGRAGGVVVRALVGLGHSLQLNVIVEGIETAEQARFVRDCGCDEMQGFMYGSDLTAREASDLLESQLTKLSEAEPISLAAEAERANERRRFNAAARRRSRVDTAPAARKST